MSFLVGGVPHSVSIGGVERNIFIGGIVRVGGGAIFTDFRVAETTLEFLYNSEAPAVTDFSATSQLSFLYNSSQNPNEARFVDLVAIATAESKTPKDYVTFETEKLLPDTWDLTNDSEVLEVGFERYNPIGFTSNFDFTGVHLGRIKLGAMITKDIMVQAAHFHNGVGEAIRFFDSNNVRVDRLVADTRILGSFFSSGNGLDIALIRLDAPVPDTVKVYAMYDEETMGSLTSLTGIPTMRVNQESQISYEQIRNFEVARTIYGNDATMENVFVTEVNTNVPIAIQQPVGGDSGGPTFSYINDELVLMGCLTTNFSDTDPTKAVSNFLGYTVVKDLIETVIAELNA